jgi:AcrR family transcriptional regulator
MAVGSDRRVRKTRRALHGALLELIIEKGYEAVTVQDIIDRADVVRSTFYAHFTDKQDLLRGGIQDLQAGLRQACTTPAGEQPQLFGFSREFFRHASAHRRLFRALVGRRGGATLVLPWFTQMIADLVREELTALSPRQHSNAVPLDVVVQFVTGACMSLLTWWLDAEAGPSPQEMDRMFRELAIPAVVAALASDR